MRSAHAVAIVAALLVVTSPLGRAHAGEPGAQLQRQVDRVVAVLEDQGRDGAARRQAVRAIVDETFDLQEAARRTLGHEWAERTLEEQARFVNLFVDLIDRAYLRRLDQWDGQRIVVNDDAIDGDRAIVRTAIVSRDGGRTPVDYVMRHSPGGPVARRGHQRGWREPTWQLPRPVRTTATDRRLRLSDGAPAGQGHLAPA